MKIKGDRIVVTDKTRFYLDGKEVSESVYYERHKRPADDAPNFDVPTGDRAWPIYSDALGVHPERIAEHERVCRERGIPTECLPDGRVVLRDRAHRKQYLKAFGYRDNNGGYGD